MLNLKKRIILVTGHYGSGKTNFSVNLALELCRAGTSTALVDLDIVNPYFRSADFAAQLEAEGIEAVLPVYANSNLDIPALTARMDGVLDTDKTVVVDVGGDDAGALALGRYSGLIERVGGCEMLYVVNCYRYLTRTADEAKALLNEIEKASRMHATALVNNSNLGEITTATTIGESMDFAREVALKCNLPLLCTTAPQQIFEETQKLLGTQETVYPVAIYVKKPWDA